MAASFFFWGADPSRNHLLYFALSLAYQLTIFSGAVGKKIDAVLDANPTLLHASVDVQWKKLIVDTVIEVADLPPAAIILDGLDECIDEGDQKTVFAGPKRIVTVVQFAFQPFADESFVEIGFSDAIEHRRRSAYSGSQKRSVMATDIIQESFTVQGWQP